MPFGKYKGRLLSEIPTEYLVWLRTIELRPFLRDAVATEWTRRHADSSGGASSRGAPEVAVRQMADTLVTQGYRVLAHAHHPDRGGSLVRMQEVNAAVAWLRRVTRPKGTGWFR